MCEDIFKEFGVETIEYVRQLENGAFGSRLGEIIDKYTEILRSDPPDIVIVPGDVDVTVGAAMAAKRLQHHVVHLEAGLRSYDVNMPEEQNRKLVDSIADFLLAPSEDAYQNLIFHEGHSHQKVAFVGNIMIDSLVQTLDPSRAQRLLDEFGLEARDFAVGTIHRPANVDDPVQLEKLCRMLANLSRKWQIVLPLHPRTKRALEETGHIGILEQSDIIAIDAMPYPDFVSLLSVSRFVLTDSGGIQEEASFLKVPCFTLRNSTERPVTVVVGGNTLVSEDDLFDQIDFYVGRGPEAIDDISLWDGRTAERCANILRNNWLEI
jgi:UDP-N-acetylglucosamine 2-epimerase (non-hydrolysing)